MTILKLAWRSQRADASQCAHFPTDICSVIQEGGEITVEKCGAPRRVSASTTHCHLDETNMDITTVHPFFYPYNFLERRYSEGEIEDVNIPFS